MSLDMRSVQMGTECAVHRHRELVPLHVHHVLPTYLGGPDTAANKITVCANGHYSIHALLDLMFKYAKSSLPVPWVRRRLYGRKVRQYAQRAFEESRS